MERPNYRLRDYRRESQSHHNGARLDIKPTYIEAQRISPFRFCSADIGGVANMMIHRIDIICHLVNSEVEQVDAVGINVLDPHEDVANARVVFKIGEFASFAAS